MTLSPRVKAAIELMVFGSADGPPLKRVDAAKAVQLSDTTLRIAFANPVVVQHYNAQLEVLRTSARPRAFHQIERLAESAKSEKVKFDAAKHIDTGGRSDSAGIVVNVGVNVQPGYLISTADYPQGEVQQIQRQAMIGLKALKDKG